jgi:hypothetical protein
MPKDRWWLAGVVLLGLGLRAYHYLRVPAVWIDEAAVIMNVLDKDYASLLGPLRFHEAAPPLFLWLEKAVSTSLGDEPLAMRLVPFLASCAALVLMLPIARRLLPAAAVPWALLLFACSEQLLWHACEAKPYALDVLAATVLLQLVLQKEHVGLPGLLLALSLLAPALVWLSYPACFLYGGVATALAPAVWRDGRAGVYAAFGLLVAAVGVSFVGLVLGPVTAQRDPVILDSWAKAFPAWHRPWHVPMWVIAETLEVGRYVCKPLGQGIMALAVAGGFLCWRQGQRGMVVLLGTPLLLALVAACLHQYPYGGYRVMAFAAPAVLLLAASAIPPTISWLGARHRFAVAPLVPFLLMPVSVAVQRVVWVWPVADNGAVAEFVEAHRRPGEPVVGNDWAHLYHFRRLGATFHLANDRSVAVGERVWVIFTGTLPPEEVWNGVLRLAPPGWRVIARYDALYSATALFEKPE